MRYRSMLIDNPLPVSLRDSLDTLADLQRRAENLSQEVALLKRHIAEDLREPRFGDPHRGDLHGSESILIADDHAVVRSMAQEILEGFGYRVLVSDSSLHGYGADDELDLVMIDVPFVHADHLARLQQLRRWGESTRLVICTPLPEAGRNVLRAWGADAFVSKPYFPRELAACVRHALDGADQPKKGAIGTR